jgi:hypothetical protein
MAHGVSVSKASSTLVDLAEQVQKTIEEHGNKGLQLVEEIRVVSRKNLEALVEAMKLKTREKRMEFFDPARELLLEPSNEWFAFFTLQF